MLLEPERAMSSPPTQPPVPPPRGSPRGSPRASPSASPTPPVPPRRRSRAYASERRRGWAPPICEMTEFSQNTPSGNGPQSDYDRQFEEDLERARALSLESLALEKFRMQKQLERISDLSDTNQRTPSGCISSGRKPIEKLEPKPRPRPSLVGARVSQILAPPPSGQRRNSAAAAVPSKPDVELNTNDLISFNSPSPTDKTNQCSIQDLCGSERLQAASQEQPQVTVRLERSKSSVGTRSSSFYTATYSNHHTFTPPLGGHHGSYRAGSLDRNVMLGGQTQFLPQQRTSVPQLSSGFGHSPLQTDGAVYNTVIPVMQSTNDFQGKQIFDQSSVSWSAFERQVSSTSNTSVDSNVSLDVLKVMEKRDNNNLIDLPLFNSASEVDEKNSVRVSVLDLFDPLHVDNNCSSRKTSTSSGSHSAPESENKAQGDSSKEGEDADCSGSVYDPYDPFDYMYAPSHDGSQSDPVYAAVVRESTTPVGCTSPPPLPPRNSAAWSTIERRRSSLDRKRKTKTRLYENIQVQKCRAALHDVDLQAFHKMVKNIRKEFPFSDQYTNVGLVISPTIDSYYAEGTSIKLIVHSKSEGSPVIFTCDVNSTVEHVILHVVCELEGELSGDAKDYVLKVWGLAEYLTSHTSLADYEHVHQCLKLEKDVELSILHVDELKRPLGRTIQDDNNDSMLSLEDLLPNEPVLPISHDQLVILLETLEKEMERVQNAAAQMSDMNDPTLMPSLQSTGVLQTVKLICALMGNIETQEITEAVEAFVSSCLQFIPSSQTVSDDTVGVTVCHPEILGEDGDYSVVTLRKTSSRRSEILSLHETICANCENIRVAVQGLVETYCHAFRVDFQISSRAELPTNTKSSCELLDPVLVHVGGLHRLLQGWNHEEFIVAAQIYHGTRPVGHPVLTRPTKKTTNFSSHVMFDYWLNFEGTNICMLPRESRLVFVVYGQIIVPPEGNDSKDAPSEPQVQKIELGWAAMQFFNCEGVMTQGSCLLSLWPAVADKRLGPAPAPGTRPHGDVDPVLWVEVPEYGSRIMFPPLIDPEVPAPKYDFNSLDRHTQALLENISQSDTYARTPPEDREIFWEKRHYLHSLPNALPKVLLAAHSWDWACLGDLHAMLHGWSQMDPVNALQLLLPCFPDVEVRRVAVSWVQNMGSDELVDYLPQLVQALKHETWEASPLARFLLERSLTSPRVAHHLYWLLMQSLPGQCPQNSSEVSIVDDAGLGEARYHRRLQLMLRALLAISGEALRQRFLSQQLLVKSLYEIAENIKITKETLRLNVLIQELQVLHHTLEESVTCLPLSPSLEVGGIHVRSCSYFPSNTLPLKINFQSIETGIIPAIFKVGDDLQQDMLTIQMVRIMDKLWLKEGLDLKMVTFSCVPTGHKRGMIEMVTNAETLRKIQVELGLTGSFKDRPIAEWLAKHNPSAFEYERAVKNFTASCAGYSVATYILGICDRHNDNIMLKTSGHLFHIDFGKFLGDAQMFGNFKRDRTPFVLTSDMAYVINGGDKPSAKFHHFVDLCCQAFNIVRKHGNLILNLFGLMTSSGIPGVTMDAVHYVQKALLPGLSNPEAAAMFARMIESSLKSWFTQFNFFLHNLAQLRFTGDHNDGELLSFIPRTYSMQQEGRIKSVCVYGYQKRYDPEKYYVYILRIERANNPDPTYLFRSYKEFCEFHQKLCILFPLAKYHSLPTGISMGRSNIKQVAEKRKVEIERFLKSLFMMADEISHSDLVYTFFHPLLRDQQEANIHAKKVKEPKVRRESGLECWQVRGQLKLSFHYQRQPGILMVMVHHARGLPTVAGGQEPSPYVKVYLKPDPSKITKRKTKVVKRNCHPTFMETLEYRMPLEVVRHRRLEATVWNHDALQENEFLGGVVLPLCSVDLTSETDEWYSLGNVTRS